MSGENRKRLVDLIKASLILHRSGSFPYSVLKKNEYLFSSLENFSSLKSHGSLSLEKSFPSSKSVKDKPVKESNKEQIGERKLKFAENLEPRDSKGEGLNVAGESMKEKKPMRVEEKESPDVFYCDDGITYTRDPDKFKSYRELVDQIKLCRKCPLWEKKTNYVPGEGNLDADIMFVGEAPGADEDAQGRPFVGRAGQLLTQILNILGVDRRKVYIGNVLKCRPPGNRDPKPNEIITCLPYLRKQIEIIRPKVICTLGNFSTKSLLGLDTGITKLRGKVYKYRGNISLVPTYHPSAALRNPSLKDKIIEDIRVALREARRDRSS